MSTDNSTNSSTPVPDPTPVWKPLVENGGSCQLSTDCYWNCCYNNATGPGSCDYMERCNMGDIVKTAIKP